jgi:hypothetical protein
VAGNQILRGLASILLGFEFHKGVPQSQATDCNAMNTSVELEQVEPAAAEEPPTAVSVMLCTNFERGFGCLNAISARRFDRRN